MFLEREDVNPDQPDTEYGRTPLSWAAQRGSEGVVKVLLERDGVNPDQPDTDYGRTPLSWAAVYGREGVVKMLLKRDDVNPDQPDTYGKTPLQGAKDRGHTKVVKMLLERQDALTTIPAARTKTKTLYRWPSSNYMVGLRGSYGTISRRSYRIDFSSADTTSPQLHHLFSLRLVPVAPRALAPSEDN